MSEQTQIGKESVSGTQSTFMHRIQLGTVSSEIVGLVYSVRDLDVRAIDNGLSGAQVKEAFAEMYPPAALFAAPILSMPSVYSNLRDWLDSKGAGLRQHSSRRVMMTLATFLYDEAEEREAATQIAGDIIASGRRIRRVTDENVTSQNGANNNSRATSHSASTGNDEQVAHRIAMRFKDESCKFSGDIGQCWNEYVSEYQQVARDYKLTETHKKQFLHNLLKGDAKRFYLNRVHMYTNRFSDAIRMVETEYNSVVRQNRVKNYLNNLRLNKFVADGADELSALEKVYRLIIKLSPQVPQSHKGDAHKIEFLRNATVGANWATEPLSRIATHGLSFQDVYGELEAALHLQREARLAKARDSITFKKPDVNDEREVPGILYEGQGRYQVSKHGVGDRRNSGWKQTRKEKKERDPLTIMGCFNCDNPNHLLKNCPLALNARRAAEKRIEYYSKKKGKDASTYLVLMDLCEQIDISGEVSLRDDTVESESNTQSEVEINQVEHEGCLKEENTEFNLFEALVNYTEYATTGDLLTSSNVIDVKYSPDSSSLDGFERACLDIGASRSLIGRPQAESYYKFMGLPLVIHTPRTTRPIFRFGKDRQGSIGTCHLRIPYAGSNFMMLELDVVDIDVPLLLGLDTLDKYSLYCNNVKNQLVCENPKWIHNMSRKYGHLYYVWEYGTMYTKTELRKIHRQFYHPRPERLFELMKRAEDPEATVNTRELLEEVTAECDTCQRLSRQPGRFRVALPADDIVFNRLVCLDLMFIDGNPILHVVCKDTRFSAAVFLESESAQSVWRAYLSCWTTRYVGYSTEIHADRGPCFNSDEWSSYLQATGIKRKDSGIESHNSLGSGETYHDFLRKVYNRVRSEHRAIPKEDTLALAVHAINCTAGPNGLSPVLLVFGITPRIQMGNQDLPEQRKRMVAMKLARDEMLRVIARTRLSTAKLRNVPVSSDSDILIGSQVLFYRENSKSWKGPYTVVAGDGKQLWLLVDGTMKLVSVDKVKVYHAPSSGVPDRKSKRDFDLAVDRVIRGDVLLTAFHHQLRTTCETVPYITDSLAMNELVYLSEKIPPGDSREYTSDFLEAKKKEINGLKKHKTWKVVKRSSNPKDSNIIGGRFVCEIKNANTVNAMPKARYVAQGYNDDMKDFIVHDAPSLRQATVKLIVSFAANKGFNIGCMDFRQAYLQSEETMSRRIFIQPKKRDLEIIGINEGEVLELSKPLYGICDSGDYWSTTFFKFVKKELGMSPLTTDIAAFTENDDEDRVSLIIGLYVDDTIIAVHPSSMTTIERMQSRFMSRPIDWSKFNFVGTHVSTETYGIDRVLTITQPQHMTEIRSIPVGTTFTEFRSIRARIAWLSHSRPDVSCSINRSAQVTDSTFGAGSIKELNKAIKYVLSTRNIGLSYPKLDTNSLHLRTYAEASFASNHDLTSQLGYLVLLCDKKNRCHILSYKSCKSRRVVRSIMAGETFAFTDALDASLALRRDLSKVYGCNIPLSMYTDSKQLFDVLTKSTYPTERRLMIDVAAARESYTRFEISNIGLVRGDVNPADALTKPNFGKPLTTILKTAIDETPITQWIHRFRV